MNHQCFVRLRRRPRCTNGGGTPKRSVDVTTDVTACHDKFKNSFQALINTRADVEPAQPDWTINVSEVTFILDAFRGASYPPFVFDGPGGCPWRNDAKA